MEVFHLKFGTYSITNINQKVQPEDVQFLSLFDIELTSQFTFESKNTSIGEEEQSEGISRNGASNTALISQTRSNRRKQASTVYSPSRLQAYQEELFGRLNDSVCIKADSQNPN